jgi:transglutaminase-like putative cysteine protease
MFSAVAAFGAAPLIERGEALDLAAQITVEKYPDADEALVYGYTQSRYNPDGSGVDVSEWYTKVLTEKGKRSNQTISRSYTLPYNTLRFELVELIKADGSVEAVDVEANSKVMTNNASMSANIYNPNDKLLVVSVPGVEVGDVVHCIVTDENHRPRMADTWSNYIVFEEEYPIIKDVYEVYECADLPIRKFALKGEVGKTVTYEKIDTDEGTLYRWTAENVPRFFPEPSMPDYWTCVQRLLISTIPDWQTVSRWYWNISEPHFKQTAEMKQMAGELTNGLESDEEKIRAIFKFVSQEIRYMGISIEKDAPGYEPHDVNLTFANRHGVCRDKAALLVVMLREAGFESFPVLIHSGPKKDVEVPLPYFNHAITCVRTGEGQYMLMDSTDESTRQLLPAYLNNCSYLVADPDGEKLLTSAVEPADDNMLKIVTAASLDSDGNYQAKSSLSFEGINDNAYRGAFLRWKSEQIETYFQDILKRFLPGGKLDSLKIEPEDLQDTSRNIKVELEYHAKDVLVSGDGKALAPIYGIGTKIGTANYVLRATGLDKRRFTLETGTTCGVSEVISLDLDDSLEIFSLPEKTVIDRDYMSWVSDISANGSEISIKRETKFEAVEFSPEQYLSLKEDLKQIEYNSRKQILLKEKPYDGADSVLLSRVVTYDLADKHNWTLNTVIRQKILTYKGKKDNSELKLGYVPAWEQLTLDYARVINGDSVKEISEVEKNVMDAGWVASAPRYPEGKLLVASLPGVENDSVIEYSVTRRISGRPYFSMYKPVQSSMPVEHIEIIMNIPAGLDILYGDDDNGILYADAEDVLKKTVTSANGKTCVRWQAENIPAIKMEDALPPLYAFTPFAWAVCGEPAEFAAMVGQFAEKAIASNEALVAQKAAELAAGCKTDDEKIISVRDFVARQVRGAGPAFTGIPLEAHSSCAAVLADGYGNSLDKAILTAKLLGLCGVESEIVLVSNAPLVKELEDFEVSRLGADVFSGVLVKTNASSGVCWLGDTDQYAALGTTGSEHALAISTRNGELARIEPAEMYRSRSEQVISSKMWPNGDAELSGTSLALGTSYGSQNRYFTELTPENRRRYYESLISGISQLAEPAGELITDYSEYPGKMGYSALVKKCAVIDGELMYFTLPAGPGSLGLREDSRENPLYMPGYSLSHTEISLELPEGAEVLIMPEAQTVRLPGDAGWFAVSTELSDNRLDIAFDAQLKPAIVETSDYDDLFDIDTWLKHAARRTIVISCPVAE